jgi:hypothetical protein
MKNPFKKSQSRFFCLSAIAVLVLISAIRPQETSFNVPLEHPVYNLIDMLPLPGTTSNISLSNRPFTRQQVCTLLVYEIQNSGTLPQKKLLEFYLREFADTGKVSVKKVDVPLDGIRTHAYPYIVTGTYSQDSGFLKTGFTALGLDSLSSSVEFYNKTAIGGRLYSNINGFLSYFDGAIITEYGSKEQWTKTNDPKTGRNYTTIMAKDNQPGNFIGYDDVTAYAKPPLKNFDITLGFDRVSWGYAGASGLFFSGEGRPFLMAKASRTIGKLDYTFLIGKLTGDFYEQKRVVYAKHITYSPVRWFALGLSDAVVSADKGLKPAYLLPFVPYYFVDHYIGGSDNRIMSFDAQWNVRHHVSLYGELLIDEISNLLGFVTNKKANDEWAGVCGVKWFNPVPVIAASLLKAEFVQLEPWVYTRYSRAGAALSNNPVDFGHPIGNQMGPHSRNVSLTFSGMLSEKIHGSIGVSQYLKGAGPGSDILSGNNFVFDTVNGVPLEHQIYSNKDYRFKTYSRNRTVISASGIYTFEHWLQAEISGDFVHEQVSAKGNYFHAGVDVRVNY